MVTLRIDICSLDRTTPKRSIPRWCSYGGVGFRHTRESRWTVAPPALERGILQNLILVKLRHGRAYPLPRCEGNLNDHNHLLISSRLSTSGLSLMRSQCPGTVMLYYWRTPLDLVE